MTTLTLRPGHLLTRTELCLGKFSEARCANQTQNTSTAPGTDCRIAMLNRHGGAISRRMCKAISIVVNRLERQQTNTHTKTHTLKDIKRGKEVSLFFGVSFLLTPFPSQPPPTPLLLLFPLPPSLRSSLLKQILVCLQTS